MTDNSSQPMNETPTSPAVDETIPPWEDARVQRVYNLLCDDKLNEPPNPEEHWEGWVARNIVAALSRSEAPVAGEIEKTKAGTINWKMEVERLNRLLKDAQIIIAEYRARAREVLRADLDAAPSPDTRVREALSSPGKDEPVPLADHDEIGRKVLHLPWAIQSAVVTIAAHCTVIKDKCPSGDVADLAGCISQDLLELTDALCTVFPAQAAPNLGMVGVENLADWFYNEGHEFVISGEEEVARALLDQFDITPRKSLSVSSTERESK